VQVRSVSPAVGHCLLTDLAMAGYGRELEHRLGKAHTVRMKQLLTTS